MSDADPGRLARLIALRNAHESALMTGEIPVRDFASLSREYRATLLEIDQLAPPAVEVDAVDEITARRAARGAGSSARQARTGKGSA